MTFLLAHLSDAHIGPLPRLQARELLGKRLTGYINWSRRGRLHDMAVLDLLVADMKAQAPDHIAMTGDILNLGLKAEFPVADAWLRGLGDPRNVSFVPGNHDAYVRSAMAPLAVTFAPWRADRGPDGGVPLATAFPYMRRRGDMALIGLSSALPTAPFLASGAIGAAQLDALAPLLESARKDGLARVVMIHHPPYKGGASAGRGLRDAAAFARVIASHGAELVIHGHNHRSMLAHLPAAGRPVPVVGVPSASAVPGSPNHRAAYHLFTIARDDGRWTVAARRRGLQADLKGIGDLGSFDPAAGEDEPRAV